MKSNKRAGFAQIEAGKSKNQNNEQLKEMTHKGVALRPDRKVSVEIQSADGGKCTFSTEKVSEVRTIRNVAIMEKRDEKSKYADAYFVCVFETATQADAFAAIIKNQNGQPCEISGPCKQLIIVLPKSRGVNELNGVLYLGEMPKDTQKESLPLLPVEKMDVFCDALNESYEQLFN